MSSSAVLSAFSRPGAPAARPASPPSLSTSLSLATHYPPRSLSSRACTSSAISSSESSSSVTPSPSPVITPQLDSSHAPGQAKVLGYSLSTASGLSSLGSGSVLDKASSGLSTPRTSLLIPPLSMHSESEHTAAADSPLSVDASTSTSTSTCSSAASSRAPSPSQPALPASPAHTPQRISKVIPVHSPSSAAVLSPALSPVVQPLSPSSPTNSSDSLSSSSSSSCSFSYGKEGLSRSGGLRSGGRTKRVPLSQAQKAVLEESFLGNHYPTREEKTALGHRIHLSGDKVHKWYDNRRTKLNKDGKGGRRGAAVELLASAFDEVGASASLRLHPYASLHMKPRSPMPSVAAPIIPLLPQQLQQLQLQQHMHMQQQQQQQQLMQTGTLHTFLHPSTLHAQQLAAQQQQQQQQQQLHMAAVHLQQQAQQQHQQQQLQAAAAQEAVLRQMTLNGVDHRLAPMLSQSQLSFLQSASVSPLLQAPPVGALQPPPAGLSVQGFHVKPATPPAAAPAPTSAFHAVGQSSAAALSPLTTPSRAAHPLTSSAFKLTSSSPAALGGEGTSAAMLMSPASLLTPLGFRSASSGDVPAFHTAFAGSAPAPLSTLSSDSVSPLFTCTPTATGFSLFRPHPPATLK